MLFICYISGETGLVFFPFLTLIENHTEVRESELKESPKFMWITLYVPCLLHVFHKLWAQNRWKYECWCLRNQINLSSDRNTIVILTFFKIIFGKIWAPICAFTFIIRFYFTSILLVVLDWISAFLFDFLWMALTTCLIHVWWLR